MGVTGVAGDEHARITRLARGHVVEAGAESLADLVDRPPGDLVDGQGIGSEDPGGGGDQLVDRDVTVGGALGAAEFLHLDIQAHEIAALARNDDHTPVFWRLDDGLLPDVGKVRDGQHVHHAPGLVGRLTLERQAERPAHPAARPVAADDVAGAHRLDLAIGPLEADGHRVRWRRREVQ